MELKDVKKLDGIGWFVTSLFVVADLAGGGVVAMPIAMLQSGLYAGTAIILGFSILYCYSGHLLSENWLILRTRWDTYEEHCRKPYPEMAYRAMGKRARTFCSSTINAMLFGISVVYLLLSSTIINDFIASATGRHVGFCFMLIIIAISFWPISLLKSPQDFWWAIVAAMVTTLLSGVMIIYGTVNDYQICGPFASSNEFKFGSLVLSLGTFMFGFGGHSVFPSVQHDMKRPKDFTRATIVAFGIVTLMYGPLSVLGYVTYGNSLEESIINSVQTEWIRSSANLFIAIHCILTLTINVNPLNQEVEQLLHLPQGFGWQRVCIRTIVLIAIVFVAESVPKFGPLLDVMGGTVIALSSGVFPATYNLYLRAATYDTSLKKYIRPTFRQVIQRTSRTRMLCCMTVIVVSLVCGIATTYSALIEIATTQFSKPCYLLSFEEITHASSTKNAILHCCGPYRNISRFGDEYCLPYVPKLHNL